MSAAVRVVRVTSRAQLEDAWRVRFEVFVAEQGVPQDIEVDEHDTEPTTSHVLALDVDGSVLGTGRLLRDGPGEVHIGRLAVRRAARGRGIGAMLVTELSAIALAEHAVGQPPAVRVALSAQETGSASPSSARNAISTPASGIGTWRAPCAAATRRSTWADAPAAGGTGDRT